MLNFTVLKSFLTCIILINSFFIPKLPAQNISEKLDKYLTEYQKVKNIPSISAGIIIKDSILWVNAIGYSDVENSVLSTPKTIYRIASISKPITAVAIMQLVEQGKISIDDDALKYIPFFPKKKWNFTIRHLLNHTSGIRNYKNPEEFNSKKFFNSTRDAVEVIANDELEFKPGSKFLYTTLGYNLLAAIIENASGMQYDTYLKEKIFKPAGMNSTFTEVQYQLVHNRARGFIKNDYRDLYNAPLADLSIKYAGGGLISTPEDLLKFSRNLINGNLIKSSSLDTMLQKTKLNNGNEVSYGLGLNSDTTIYGDKYFSHEGSGTGFTSFFVVFPADSLAAVSLINVKDRNLENPALQLVLIAKGKPAEIPKYPLSDLLMNAILNSGIDSTIKYYRSVKNNSPDSIEINKNELILFISDLIKIRRSPDAIKFVKNILTDYPEDFNIIVALADAYYTDGNKGLALKNYRRASKLNSKNRYVMNMINKLH